MLFGLIQMCCKILPFKTSLHEIQVAQLRAMPIGMVLTMTMTAGAIL